VIHVVELESAPLIERPHVREGVFRSRRILNGAPGTPGNFALQLGVTPSYYSPRHRHNFDQVRFQLEGDFDFASDGVMKEGCLGYFPEGTHYGPQSSNSENSTLVLQFGGASGSGYIAANEYEKAAAELARHGSFARGVYTRLKPDGGKINKDAYEAVWEEVNGRPLVYPPERYLRPVFMDPASFDWTPLRRKLQAPRRILRAPHPTRLLQDRSRRLTRPHRKFNLFRHQGSRLHIDWRLHQRRTKFRSARLDSSDDRR
jgi:hypothetical protein